MKTLVSIIAGLFIGWLVFFKLDPWIVQSVIDMIGVEESNLGLAKLILWVILIVFTGSLTIWLAAIAGILVRIVLEGK